MGSLHPSGWDASSARTLNNRAVGLLPPSPVMLCSQLRGGALKSSSRSYFMEQTCSSCPSPRSENCWLIPTPIKLFIPAQLPLQISFFLKDLSWVMEAKNTKHSQAGSHQGCTNCTARSGQMFSCRATGECALLHPCSTTKKATATCIENGSRPPFPLHNRTGVKAVQFLQPFLPLLGRMLSFKEEYSPFFGFRVMNLLLVSSSLSSCLLNGNKQSSVGSG